MQFIEKYEAYFAPVGRIIMGGFFVMAGIDKVMNFSGTAGYIESVGFPAGTLLAIVAIVIEIGFGAALLTGYKAKMAALGLAVFVLFITFPFHGPSMWADNQMQQIMFMKNLVIFGSLLFMAAHAGRFNVDSGSAAKAEDPVAAL